MRQDLKRGKRNETYQNLIITLTFLFIISSLLLILSKPVKAGFTIKTSCDNDYCLEGSKAYINISVTNEGVQTLDINKIILRDYKENEFDSMRGAEIKSGETREFSFSFIPELDKSVIFKFKPCFLIISNQSGNLTKDMICYEFKNITIMPNPIKHCKTNFDCEDNRYCNTNLCFNLSCEGCTHPVNHTCREYECCNNNDCKYDEVCEEHKCIFLECKDNEVFGNHTCEEINCSRFKEAREHRCVYKKKFLESIRISAYIIVILFMLSFAFGKKRRIIKASMQNYIRHRKIRYYKKKEEEERSLAETHYKLLKYIKSKPEIEKHKKLIKQHEKEADRYHRKWLGYAKDKVLCPICGREVPKGYEFCPYCGAKIN